MEKEAKLHAVNQEITAAVSHVSRCVSTVNCYSPARDSFMVTCYEYTACGSDVGYSTSKIVQEPGCVPAPVWTCAKNLAPTGIIWNGPINIWNL
jgi:hypothetical protein